MKTNIKKPIRIDYYPKTKGDIDEPEEIQIKENLEKKLDCKKATEDEPLDKPIEDNQIIKYDGVIVEDIGKFIEEIMGDEEV